MRILLTVFVVLLALGLLGYAGLQIKPAPFPAFAQAEGELETIPLPEGLPLPVERFYRALYGEHVPVIHSAVISGRATLRIAGITLPGRFRFTHDAGNDYRHYIEVTLFGLPIMRVDEHFLDGKARLEMPFGVVENAPQVDQAANMALWSESMWLPSLFLTDPRVRWEVLDEASAVLVVPFGEYEEHLIVRFDSETGLVKLLEGMRYKDAESHSKTLWLNDARAWGTVNARPTLTVGAAIWLDDGTPWAVFTVEEVVYNVDVSAYIRAKGL